MSPENARSKKGTNQTIQYILQEVESSNPDAKNKDDPYIGSQTLKSLLFKRCWQRQLAPKTSNESPSSL